MAETRLLSINFARILRDLRNWGWTDEAISKETGIYRTTLSKLRTGKHKSVMFCPGYDLLRLYENEAIAQADAHSKKHLQETRLTTP